MRELWEEAGAEPAGALVPLCSVLCPAKRQVTAVFALQVQQLAAAFPESSSRRVAWVPLLQAFALLKASAPPRAAFLAGLACLLRCSSSAGQLLLRPEPLLPLLQAAAAAAAAAAAPQPAALQLHRAFEVCEGAASCSSCQGSSSSSCASVVWASAEAGLHLAELPLRSML